MLPEGWSARSLGSVLERVVKPVTPSPAALYREIGIRSHGKGIFHKPPVLGESLGDKRVFEVVPDCLVLNIVFAWEQAVARTTEAEVGMIASHRFPMYRPKSGACDIDYLVCFFKSKRGKHLLELASPGGAGRNKTLGQNDFAKLAFPMPSRAEQNRIANILTTWDEAIRAVQQLLDNHNARKKALLQKLMTGRERLRGFENPVKSLELASISNLIKKRIEPSRADSQLRCIELEHVESKTGRILGSTTTDYQSSLKATFKPGDVLFGKLRPYLKKCWLADSSGYCSTEFWVLRAIGRRCLPEFLHLICQTDRFLSACNVTSGSKMPRADWQIVSSTPFHVPTIEEQRSIIEIISKDSSAIDRLLVTRAQLVIERRGLAQQLLAGKRRVKLDPAT